MSALLRMHGVTLVRGARTLFEGLNLALDPGDALIVSGANGTGKSSLLRLAAGLLHASGGTVESADCALADDKIALDRELPLFCALDFWGGGVCHGLEAVGLDRFAGVPVRLLSSGQIKRATIARVIASAARLWLLDEPLNALDPEGSERLAAIIAKHRHGGGAVLAASHNELAGDWRKLELG